MKQTNKNSNARSSVDRPTCTSSIMIVSSALWRSISKAASKCGISTCDCRIHGTDCRIERGNSQIKVMIRLTKTAAPRYAQLTAYCYQRYFLAKAKIGSFCARRLTPAPSTCLRENRRGRTDGVDSDEVASGETKCVVR